VPLVTAEEASNAARALARNDPAVVVWWSTVVECVSAISRRERDGDLTRRGANNALERLDRMRSEWDEIEPHDAVRRGARRLLRVHPLRAADALQLAAALVASEDYPETLQFVSLDDPLVEAARREGLAVVVPA
jgi:hypothetical protein